MNLDPSLSRPDRIASLVGAPILIAYAFLGGLDRIPLQIFVVGLGVVFATNGIGGT